MNEAIGIFELNKLITLQKNMVYACRNYPSKCSKICHIFGMQKTQSRLLLTFSPSQWMLVNYILIKMRKNNVVPYRKKLLWVWQILTRFTRTFHQVKTSFFWRLLIAFAIAIFHWITFKIRKEGKIEF